MSDRSLRPLAVALALTVSLAPAGCGARGPVSAPGGGPLGERSTETPTVTATDTTNPAEPTVFAVIGDYGTDDENERAVAELVASWDPDFIITTGDDYYARAGGRGTARYDESTGAYYGRWLSDISTTGRRQPTGMAEVNAFFPSLGNHDYSDAMPSPETYLAYFTLPGRGFENSSGNERYYDFVQGPIHFFALNSNPDEPHGLGADSKQARWLKRQLAESSSAWNVVYFHHPPYSSDASHGSTEFMRWPFGEWGADVVLAGHAHVYERVERDGVTYFVNGLGGAKRYGFGEPVGGSKLRFNDDWGAQKVTASEAGLRFEFYDIDGDLVDSSSLSPRK